MDEQRLTDALNAIHDFAVRLLSRKMPLEVSTGLRHINKMAYFKHVDSESGVKIEYDEPFETSDGMTYRILIYRENGKFISRPYHPPCHGFGAYSLPLDSQEEAIKSAINSISPEHKAACRK
jgi:hypothetical protein